MKITEQFRRKIIDFKERLSEEDYELTFEDKVFMRYLVTTFLETIELEDESNIRGNRVGTW